MFVTAFCISPCSRFESLAEILFGISLYRFPWSAGVFTGIHIGSAAFDFLAPKRVDFRGHFVFYSDEQKMRQSSLVCRCQFCCMVLSPMGFAKKGRRREINSIPIKSDGKFTGHRNW